MGPLHVIPYLIFSKMLFQENQVPRGLIVCWWHKCDKANFFFFMMFYFKHHCLCRHKPTNREPTRERSCTGMYETSISQVCQWDYSWNVLLPQGLLPSACQITHMRCWASGSNRLLKFSRNDYQKSPFESISNGHCFTVLPVNCQWEIPRKILDQCLTTLPSYVRFVHIM